ncbi:MAG TPA: hypothetical protein VEK15_04280 [Vicinamibacteria bacterium]|nr:hypothetical protein [Vicinamibacteria bacterium]
MRRRRFLAYLGAVGAIAGGSLALVHSRRRKESVVLELETLLGNASGSIEIGQAYLSRVPAENDVQLLSEHLFSDIEWDILLHGNLREAVAHRVREDFRKERVVRLRGWGLALTEARLCALFAIGARGPR